MDKIDKYRWRWCKSIGKRSNGLDWRGRGDSRSGRLRQRFGTCGVGVGVDKRLSGWLLDESMAGDFGGDRSSRE
jgi:hypothetical protein